MIQAIDAASGDLIWQYRQEQPPAASFPANYGQRKRSIALYGDNVYFVSWDNTVVALDARTGKLVWQTNRGGNLLVQNSSGPIVANGVVVAGSTCQVAGFGCYVTGHDAKTGKELWRNEMIPRPGQPGDETWAGSPFESRWMTGVWGQLTYDPGARSRLLRVERRRPRLGGSAQDARRDDGRHEHALRRAAEDR